LSLSWPGEAIYAGRVSRVSRRWIPVLGATAALLCLGSPGQAVADHPPEVQNVPGLDVTRAAEPPLEATPQAECGPGSNPETGLQGRVSAEDHASGRAAQGYTCNSELVGSFTDPTTQGTVGGFKVERYVDSTGRECAYYDTTLLFPTDTTDAMTGVNVLDMSNPASPKLTDTLVSPAMITPHESLVVSQKRGLIVAVAGNPAFAPGIVDVYDVSADCRDPVLRSSTPLGVFGHESGLSPDGKTFYSASPGTETIVALDISNPSLPVPLGYYEYDSHGLSIGADGNRAYVAGINTGLIILDTSQIQARVPGPQVQEIARLTWASMSIPQNAIPVTIDGHPYVVEIDEFGAGEAVGAGRIIDIADEANPQVISNLRLEVHQPENFDAIANDPGTFSPIQGYAGHYCNVPTRVDPQIVACSMILSGLRVFDISDPYHPKEIAYFNAPVQPRTVNEGNSEASNYAMSSPSFVPERNEIWYSDGFSGFYAVKLTNDAAVLAGGCNPIRGTKGKDRLRGTSGDDCLRGRGGPDRLSGRAGDDILRGGRGRDRLRGGPGRDVIRAAGGGGDRIDCGPGQDKVVVTDGSDRWRRCEKVRRH
jgi:RTX calcium-binding nonapeptide repeat (4 copies)/LVIVD repeat